MRSIDRCLVCGFAEVRTDEVAHHGILRLGECPRCQHRWTEVLAPRMRVAARPEAEGEEAAAAA